MKKYILIFSAVLFTSSFSPKQIYFEGVIVYEHKFESADSSLSALQLAKLYGTRSELYFKAGNYKQVFNGSSLQANLYLKSYNNIYTQVKGSDTLFVTDCSKATENVISSSLLKANDTILGQTCNLLSVHTTDLSGSDYRTASYYFNDGLKINAAWYGKMKHASWDKVYLQTNALPLKIINRLTALKITATATVIAMRPQKINDNFFQLPKNAILIPQQE